MPTPIIIGIAAGTATAQPGTIQYGQFEAFVHPTGTVEFLPVIIAQGREAGPCLWLTAGIHGPEHTGPVVVYKLITQELVAQLKGTVIVIPALTPAGLRTNQYVPYHVDVNPNRLWPDGKPAGEPDPEKHPPFQLERAFARLFELITATADYLIDYHNAWTGSLSFVFQDRVLYRGDTAEGVDVEANKTEAEKLAAIQEEMVTAYGHTIITEYPADKYVKEDLHRSTSGAALLVGKIPGFTVELGTGHMPDPAIVAASLAGTRNVMRWAGMLSGDMEPVAGITQAAPGYRVRRTEGLRAPQTGVYLHAVEPGAVYAAGDLLAQIVDIWGRPVGEVRAEAEGLVIGRAHGIYFYEGDTILHVAIRDDHPLVGPYPEDYFKPKAG